MAPPPPSTPLPAPAAILLALESNTIHGAMRELHGSLGTHPSVTDARGLWRAFRERLALGANCLSPQIAIPHVRSHTVRGLVYAIGRSATGVQVDETHPAVRIVFLVAAPPDQVSEYLEFMAGLAARLRTPGTVKALLGAKSETEFLGPLTAEE
jgi:mannitol/fructose-specific phosphotransferase system IIA component (Ntr-type)